MPDALELELGLVVSCHAVLGTEQPVLQSTEQSLQPPYTILYLCSSTVCSFPEPFLIFNGCLIFYFVAISLFIQTYFPIDTHLDRVSLSFL